MKKNLLFFAIIFLLSNISIAQNTNIQLENKKGNFFFYWGYNRSFFSKTNLHFTGPNYDFTLYDISAKDRPSKFGWTYVNPSKFTIPQYNYRLGYFLNNRLAISAGVDHMKYVVTANQETTISGVITEAASSKYQGSYLHNKITLAPDFLEFEHTDGFNLVSLDFEYLHPLFTAANEKLKFYWNFGLGGIWIVTKTNVKVMGDGLDNDFHVAGFTMIGKTGPRIEWKNKLFLTSELKGGYASLPYVLIKNAEPEVGDHNLTFLEYFVALGINFRLKK